MVAVTKRKTNRSINGSTDFYGSIEITIRCFFFLLGSYFKRLPFRGQFPGCVSNDTSAAIDNIIYGNKRRLDSMWTGKGHPQGQQVVARCENQWGLVYTECSKELRSAELYRFVSFLTVEVVTPSYICSCCTWSYALDMIDDLACNIFLTSISCLATAIWKWVTRLTEGSDRTSLSFLKQSLLQRHFPIEDNFEFCVFFVLILYSEALFPIRSLITQSDHLWSYFFLDWHGR